MFTNASVGKLGRGCCDGLSAKMPQKCIGNIYMVEFGSTPPKEIIMSPRKGKGPFQKENSLPSCMSYVSFRGGGGNPQPLCYSLTCVLHKLRSKMVGDVDQLPIVTKLYNLRDEGPIE